MGCGCAAGAAGTIWGRTCWLEGGWGSLTGSWLEGERTRVMRPAARIDAPPTTAPQRDDPFAALRAELAGLPVGRRIAVLRTRRDLTQTELAQLVGRSASWLFKIEHGERRCHDLALITELAAVLRVPPGLLVDLDLGSVPSRGDSLVEPGPPKAPPAKRATATGLAARVSEALAQVTARLDGLERRLDGLDLNGAVNGDGDVVTVWVSVTIGDAPAMVPVRLSRRAVLAAGGAALLGLPAGLLDPDEHARLAAAVEAPGRADTAIVAHFQTLLAHYRRLDDAIGARRLLVPVRSSLELIDHLGKTAPPPVRQALLFVSAQYLELTGWLRVEVDDHAKAQRAYGGGRERAAEAGEDALARYVLMSQSEQAHSRRNAAEAVKLAQAAQAGEGELTPAARAWAADLEARAWALAGRPGPCKRKLDEAEGLLGASAEAGRADEPPWIYHFQARSLAVHRGVCLTDLGEAGAAVEALSAAIAGLPADWARDRAYYLSWQAQAHAGAGDLEQAGAVGCEAARLAIQLAHTRTLNKLRDLHTALAATGTHAPAVTDLADLLQPGNGLE